MRTWLVAAVLLVACVGRSEAGTSDHEVERAEQARLNANLVRCIEDAEALYSEEVRQPKLRRGAAQRRDCLVRNCRSVRFGTPSAGECF